MRDASCFSEMMTRAIIKFVYISYFQSTHIVPAASKQFVNMCE